MRRCGFSELAETAASQSRFRRRTGFQLMFQGVFRQRGSNLTQLFSYAPGADSSLGRSSAPLAKCRRPSALQEVLLPIVKNRRALLRPPACCTTRRLESHSPPPPTPSLFRVKRPPCASHESAFSSPSGFPPDKSPPCIALLPSVRSFLNIQGLHLTQAALGIDLFCSAVPSYLLRSGSTEPASRLPALTQKQGDYP
jgi:hypothetical protein